VKSQYRNRLVRVDRREGKSQGVRSEGDIGESMKAYGKEEGEEEREEER
jgi:hypothetical protein